MPPTWAPGSRRMTDLPSRAAATAAITPLAVAPGAVASSVPSSQSPALPIPPPDQRVGFPRILAAQILRVPLDPFADAVGDVAEVIGFGEPARVFEVGGAGLAALAGAEP